MNTISTKKNIGDVVWFMNNNKPIYGTIIEIRHNVYLNDVNYETIIISEKYYVEYGNQNHISLNFEEIFRTKNELIESL